MTALSILVVDDDIDNAHSLGELFEIEGHNVRVVHSGEDAISAYCRETFDVAFMDVMMPGMNGVEAARLIKRASPNTRIVALSMYGDAYYQQQMFTAGASAYVLKNEAIADLVEAIQAALRGERFVSPTARPTRTTVARRSAELDQRVLSDREIEVLRLLVEGRRTKEIAEVLAISAKTVETYRGRLMLKLGIDNFAELVKFAVRAGITSTEL